MKNVVVLLGMLVCLFVPSAFFTFIGYKSMQSFGLRPSAGGKLMIALIMKLVACATVVLGILIVILYFYAGKK